MGSSSVLLVAVGVLLTIVAPGHAAYQQSRSCSMGPAYWCSRLSNAVECKAVERCVPLWQRQSMMPRVTKLMSQRTNVLCQMFEVALLSIKSSLQSTPHVHNVYSATPKACADLVKMNRDFAPLCHDITRKYLRPILIMLKHNVSTTVIANLMSHCDTPMSMKSMRPFTRQPFPETIPAARTFQPQQKRKVDPKPKNSIECSMCVKVMNYFDTIIENNSTEAEIEQALESICNLLPSSYMREMCDAIVEDYTPTLIRLIVAEFSPVQICQALNMCPKKNVLVAPKPFARNVQPLKYQSKKTHNGIECSVCVKAMNYVESFLEKNSTLEEIENALDAVCNFVPTSRDQCEALIKEYTPAIIELILQELPPVHICQVLGMCPTKKENLKLRKLVPRKNSIECQFCVNVMNYLDSLLEDNSTQQQIEHALEQVCSFLPQAVRTECDSLVEQYLPVLVELVVAEFTPQDICQALGLCSSKLNHHRVVMKSSRKTALKPSKTTVGSLQCIACVQVFNYVDAFISENKTEEKIVRALERVCAFMPASVRDECNQVVEQYTPVLIHLIVADFTSQEICQALGMCKAVKKVTSTPHKHHVVFSPRFPFKKPHYSQALSVRKSLRGPQCDKCVHIMNYMQSFLEKNDTEQEIQQYLERVCPFLPPQMRNECISLVEQYTPIIINLLVSEFTPLEVCQAIYMCPQSRQNANSYSSHSMLPALRSLTTTTCKQGPRYWCQSVETAKSCGVPALLVCSRKYWATQH